MLLSSNINEAAVPSPGANDPDSKEKGSEANVFGKWRTVSSY